MLYFIHKYLHIIGAAVLLGTGAGIAFLHAWSIVLYLFTGVFWLPVVGCKYACAI
jgi:uncharacterized membrane protein